MRFLIKVIVIAFALWLTTFIVTGVHVVPYEDTPLATVLTYLLIALIFGLVNAIVGTFVRIVAFPLYVLTLGLISFIVNGLLLLLVDWISEPDGLRTRGRRLLVGRARRARARPSSLAHRPHRARRSHRGGSDQAGSAPARASSPGSDPTELVTSATELGQSGLCRRVDQPGRLAVARQAVCGQRVVGGNSRPRRRPPGCTSRRPSAMESPDPPSAGTRSSACSIDDHGQPVRHRHLADRGAEGGHADRVEVAGGRDLRRDEPALGVADAASPGRWDGCRPPASPADRAVRTGALVGDGGEVGGQIPRFGPATTGLHSTVPPM